MPEPLTAADVRFIEQGPLRPHLPECALSAPVNRTCVACEALAARAQAVPRLIADLRALAEAVDRLPCLLRIQRGALGLDSADCGASAACRVCALKAHARRVLGR